jgi:hypothetical protein
MPSLDWQQPHRRHQHWKQWIPWPLRPVGRFTRHAGWPQKNWWVLPTPWHRQVHPNWRHWIFSTGKTAKTLFSIPYSKHDII